MSLRIRWTPEEEEYLKHLKDTEKLESWREIAEKMREQFKDSVRSGKQCRQRYINYARFDEKQTKTSPWSQEDDEKFTKLYFQFGAKWACIGKQMPEKSQNCLKNRFYGGLRRLIRKINKIQRNIKVRKTKPLRYETLMRVLDYKFSLSENSSSESHKSQEFQNFLNLLKSSLLQETWNVMNEIESSYSIFELVQNIHEFNARIRGLNFKKSKNIEQVKEMLKQKDYPSSIEVSNFHVDSSTVQKSQSQGEESVKREENVCEQLPVIEQCDIKNQEQDKILELLPEMGEFVPKIERGPDSNEFDFEISNILQEQFKCQAFSFFY